jgi:hypothetical protein
VKAPHNSEAPGPQSEDYNVKEQCSTTSMVLQGQGILSQRAAENVFLKTVHFGIDPTGHLRPAQISGLAFRQRLDYLEQFQASTGARLGDLVHSQGLTQALLAAREWMTLDGLCLPMDDLGGDNGGISFDTQAYLVCVNKLAHRLIGLRGGPFVNMHLSGHDWASAFVSTPWFAPVPIQLAKDVLGRIWHLIRSLEASPDYWQGSSFGGEPCLQGADDVVMTSLINDVDTLVYLHACSLDLPRSAASAPLSQAEVLSQYRASLNSADGEAPPDRLLHSWCRSGPRSVDAVTLLFADVMRRRVDGWLVDVVADPVSALVDRCFLANLHTRCSALSEWSPASSESLSESLSESSPESSESLSLRLLTGCMQDLARLILRSRVRLTRCSYRRQMWVRRATGQPPARTASRMPSPCFPRDVFHRAQVEPRQKSCCCAVPSASIPATER